MAKISVVVNTRNEEQNIGNCLGSVAWADEIVVVDMCSTDRTIELARTYTDRIYSFERVGYVEPARKFAVEQASHEWILIIDADEMVPMELRDKLRELAERNTFDVVRLPRRNYFFGTELKGGSWGALQDVQARFFKRTAVTFTDRIHEGTHIHPSARSTTLRHESLAMLHFNYLDVEHFLEKLNRYTTVESMNARQAGNSFSLARLTYMMCRDFFGRLFIKRGYRDGFTGWGLAFLMAMYRLSSEMKLRLLDRYGITEGTARDAIRDEYQRIALAELKRYETSDGK